MSRVGQRATKVETTEGVERARARTRRRRKHAGSGAALLLARVPTADDLRAFWLLLFSCRTLHSSHGTLAPAGVHGGVPTSLLLRAPLQAGPSHPQALGRCFAAFSAWLFRGATATPWESWALAPFSSWPPLYDVVPGNACGHVGAGSFIWGACGLVGPRHR